jgi:Holliday junction resolvasome RuvABC endonuclease subunit
MVRLAYGIDPGVTTTVAISYVDYASLDGNTQAVGTAFYTGGLTGETPFKQGQKVRADLSALIHNIKMNYPDHESIAVIENYGFANKFTLSQLTTIGTLTRVCLVENQIPFHEIPPKTLKKFATDNGNASKADMLAAVRTFYRADCETKDHNAADALLLAYMGIRFLGGRPLGYLTDKRLAAQFK